MSKNNPKRKFLTPHEPVGEMVDHQETPNQWRMKASTAHLLICEICGENTKWGKTVRGVRLCDRHWTLRNRLRAHFGRFPRAGSKDRRPMPARRIEKDYWDLTPEERFEQVREMLAGVGRGDRKRRRKRSKRTSE